MVGRAKCSAARLSKDGRNSFAISDVAILVDEPNPFSNHAVMSQPVLRELFGPNREELWRQLASELGASYVEGDFWTRGKIQASHAGWLITLEEHGKYHHTRMRAPFLNPGGFRFTVYRKGIFTELGKYLGMQDVAVGHPDFDRDFVIKGTDETKLRQIFGNARIRELIAAQPRIHFEVKDASGIFERGLFGERPPEHLDLLEFEVESRPSIKEKAQLRLLFDLFAETLDELCRMGTAKSAQVK
jgi:hypothetical protein